MDDRNLLPQILSNSSALSAVAAIQAQNTEHTLNITEQATFFSREDLSTTLSVVMDDRDLLPQLLPISSAPLLNGTQSSYLSPTMVQLISEGANSIIQDQDMMAMSRLIQWNNTEIFQQNNNFNGVNHQSFSYAALLLQQNFVDAGAGIDTGIPNGQIMTNQISPSAPLQNYDINPHSAWDPQGPPLLFTTLLHQDSHDSGIQNILDMHSQYSVPPICQTYPWLEPYGQSTLVPVPPTLYDHQHAYTPMLPEPPFLSGYDNQNSQYHLRAMMPNGHVEQGVGGSLRLSGGSVRVLDQSNDEYNQLLDTPNLQGKSSIMYEPTTLSSSLTTSQPLSSRILGLSSRTTKGVSSQVFSSMVSETGLLRPERALDIQPQQLAPVSANRVTTLWKGKNVQYEPPRRGRPPKRREAGESSSGLKHRKIKKGSSGTEIGGTTTISQEPNKTSGNVWHGDQNTNPTIPYSAPNPGGFINGMYGLAFERNGVPIDPHLRLFRALPGK